VTVLSGCPGGLSRTGKGQKSLDPMKCEVKEKTSHVVKGYEETEVGWGTVLEKKNLGKAKANASDFRGISGSGDEEAHWDKERTRPRRIVFIRRKGTQSQVSNKTGVLSQARCKGTTEGKTDSRGDG